jgi:hypothetical protein
VATAAKAPRGAHFLLRAARDRLPHFQALVLTTPQIDLSGRVVLFESLKKRHWGVYRAVPVPPELRGALDLVHAFQ